MRVKLVGVGTVEGLKAGSLIALKVVPEDRELYEGEILMRIVTAPENLIESIVGGSSQVFLEIDDS